MLMDSPSFLEELIQHLNAAHHTTLRAGARYASGEQGAFALTDAQGRRYVLKWQPGSDHLERIFYAQTVTEHLRARGYSAPAYAHIGTALGRTYSIQQALPGTTMHRLPFQLVPEILQLQALHASTAPPGPREWPCEVIQTVLHGGDGYCLHASLQQHSPETAAMLRTLQHLVTDDKNGIAEINEIVHFDFQAANFLSDQCRVSGVVDWEGAQAGDSAFDLATLLFYNYDEQQTRDFLWKYTLARRSIEVLSVYLAHLILRQVDWSLRHHDTSVSERYIRRSQALLAEIEARM